MCSLDSSMRMGRRMGVRWAWRWPRMGRCLSPTMLGTRSGAFPPGRGWGCDHCPPSAVRAGPFQPKSNGLERAYANDARRATSADGSRSAWVHLSMQSARSSQPHDTRDPARNPSRPFHGGWSAMPLMDGAPSRPERAGPAKVVATAVEVLARAVVPSRGHCCAHRHHCSAPVIPAKAGIALLRSGSLLSQG